MSYLSKAALRELEKAFVLNPFLLDEMHRQSVNFYLGDYFTPLLSDKERGKLDQEEAEILYFISQQTDIFDSILFSQDLSQNNFNLDEIDEALFENKRIEKEKRINDLKIDLLGRFSRSIVESTMRVQNVCRYVKELNHFLDFHILGEAKSLIETRKVIWSSCFGDSLRTLHDNLNEVYNKNILIIGEPGTEKKKIAKIIAETRKLKLDLESGPSNKNKTDPTFSKLKEVTIFVPELTETVLDDLLFGYVDQDDIGENVGLLESQNNGTIIIEEIADLPLRIQYKLLRTLTTETLYQVGSNKPIQTKVHIIATTSRNILQMVKEGTFSNELFECLTDELITTTPLRKHPEDLIFIMSGLLGQMKISSIRDGYEQFLMWVQQNLNDYHWPGNISELMHLISRWNSGTHERFVELRRKIDKLGQQTLINDVPDVIGTAEATLQDAENWYVQKAFKKYQFNKSHTAKALGIGRSTLIKKLQEIEKHNLSKISN